LTMCYQVPQYMFMIIKMLNVRFSSIFCWQISLAGKVR
jgi:hypothetical protein